MNKIEVHGTYIRDVPGAGRIMEISEDQAKLLVLNSHQQDGDWSMPFLADPKKQFLNKGYLFLHVAGESAVTLTLHDYTWHLWNVPVLEAAKWIRP